MKLVQTDNKWYFESPDGTIVPFKMIIENVANFGIEKRCFVLMEKDNPRFFEVGKYDITISSQFSLAILDSLPDVNPFIVVYNVHNTDLAKKVAQIISDEYPGITVIIGDKEIHDLQYWYKTNHPQINNLIDIAAGFQNSTPTTP